MPDSRSQVRLAHAVLQGLSSTMPHKVAAEIVSKMHGRHMTELPEKASKKRKLKKHKKKH